MGEALTLPAKVFVLGTGMMVTDGTVTRVDDDVLDLRCATPLAVGARLVVTVGGRWRIVCAVTASLDDQRYVLVRTVQPRTEARASARIIVEMGVDIIPLARLGTVTTVYAPVELSIAGLKLVVPSRPPEVGDLVHLRLHLAPDTAPLPAFGNVARVAWEDGKWVLAIAFTEVPEGTLDELGLFLLARS